MEKDLEAFAFLKSKCRVYIEAHNPEGLYLMIRPYEGNAGLGIKITNDEFQRIKKIYEIH